MVTRTLLAAVCLAAAVVGYPSAQSSSGPDRVGSASDLDTLMSQVLDHRDENWKKLQQYTLTERETLQITALAVFRLFGYEREYLWFPREGFFVRSPVKADGVVIDEDKRQREEAQWLKNAQNAEKSRKERETRRAKAGAAAEGDVPVALSAVPGDLALTGAVDDIISQTFEPGFIQSANFMQFKFDAGSYALAGRERMLERDVLKIEYYPKRLFRDDNPKKPPCEQRSAASTCTKEEEFDQNIDAKMNKVSLVTLWVDPAEKQILKFEFRFQDLDFLPGRTLIHFESARSTMEMSEPFANVWLPAAVGMRFRLGSAAGPLEARYDVKYRDYRLPEVTGRIR
jgi:transcription termination factor NusB